MPKRLQYFQGGCFFKKLGENGELGMAEKKVLVTGGASFIGSNLVGALITKGSRIKIVDNLSSGRLENIKEYIDAGQIEFFQEDLLNPESVKKGIKSMDVVFHLAADHGGRGYVDLHQVECSTNFILDGQIFKTCCELGIKKVVFASSGCVYPNYKQTNPKEEVYLTKDIVAPPYDADNLYGWAKLMGELVLKAYYQQFGMKSASCRYFTVYGPKGVENHAVIAMIARAFLSKDPFEVWGTGEQIRNWTYIDDIVRGTILAAEKIEDATAINLGTMERIRVLDAAQEVLKYTGRKANIVTRPEMPTGPLNRVADNSLAKKLLNWKPEVKFLDGLHRTIDWYFSVKDRGQVRKIFKDMLTKR